MDVTSLYTNIPQEEGITTVCKAYEAFYNRNIPIPRNSLKEMLQLILGENSFSFNGRNYLQTHGTAMGTKMAVAFANIFMSEVDSKSERHKTITVDEIYIDDVFSLWGCERDKIQLFIKEANKHHATIKFTAEISEKEINFLDTTIFKGERFHNDHILDIRTNYKSTKTFQYTYFTSCYAPGVGKGFIKGEALRLLRTNSSEHTFKDNIANLKLRLFERGYPLNLVNNALAEVQFKERESTLKNQNKGRKKILPFFTKYNPAIPNLKKILMSKWHHIENQPLLREIYREKPIISYKKGKSLKDILVRAKL